MRQREALLLLVLVVLCFGGGCASRRNVLSLGADSTAVLRIRAEPLRKGNLLRLALQDGSERSGYLRAATADSLILGPAPFRGDRPNRHEAERHAVALAEIRAGSRIRPGGSELLLLREGSDEAGPALQALQIGIGDLLYWRTRGGASGSGYLIALSPDSLVLADRQRWRPRYGHWPPPWAEVEEAGAVCRLAMADVAALEAAGDWTDDYMVVGLFAALILAAVYMDWWPPPWCPSPFD